MRLWAWLAAPAARKNVLQVLVLLVLVANVAVSRPFRQLWRQLRAEETVHMSVAEIGVSNVPLTKPYLTTHLRTKHPDPPRAEICTSCNLSCLHRALPDHRNMSIEQPTSLPTLEDVSPEVEVLLSEPIINPYHFGYVHNPSDLCKGDGVEIIFFISTTPDDLYRRREIRQDKLGLFRSLDMFRSVEALFVMGVPSPDDYLATITQTLIDLEAKKYRDIIQVNFTDTPANLHIKSISVLRWAPAYCRGLKYVIHTSDDVILEMKIIYALRYIGKRHENFILGKIEHQLPVASYPLSKDMFPQDYLPPFVRKGLIGYPVSTARLLYEATLRVAPFSMSDIYVTGMCAPRVGAELLEDRRFRFDVMSDDESGELI